MRDFEEGLTKGMIIAFEAVQSNLNDHGMTIERLQDLVTRSLEVKNKELTDAGINFNRS